jgi:hypothetical protein
VLFCDISQPPVVEVRDYHPTLRKISVKPKIRAQGRAVLTTSRTKPNINFVFVYLHGNKGSVQFVDQLRKYQVVRAESATCIYLLLQYGVVKNAASI